MKTYTRCDYIDEAKKFGLNLEINGFDGCDDEDLVYEVYCNGSEMTDIFEPGKGITFNDELITPEEYAQNLFDCIN